MCLEGGSICDFVFKKFIGEKKVREIGLGDLVDRFIRSLLVYIF